MNENDSHYNRVTSTSGNTPVTDTSGQNFSFPPTTPPSIPPGGTFPNLPLPPSLPDGNTSTFPSFPSQSYGQVRFLNASTNTFGVDITVDGNPFVLNSRFGDISNYDWIADGFHTITVRRSTSIRTVLFQQNLPFSANQKVTMVLVDSAFGGLEMTRVIDTGCTNLPQNTGCYRFANMTYTGSAFDLLLSNGETIFRNIGYRSASSYKQALAGTYQFMVTNANLQITMRELPIIIIGATGTATGARETLLTYQATIEPGKNFTTYLIGNNWSDYSFRAVTVED